MTEYLPACTYDGVGVGYDVGIYDKSILTDSMAFSTADLKVTDGGIALAEAFSTDDGIIKNVIKQLSEAFNSIDSIANYANLGLAEAFSIKEYIPACTYDGVGVGYDVGIYDESWPDLSKSGELTKAESFSITDGVHSFMRLLEAFSTADSATKAGASAIAESLSLVDTIVTGGGLTKTEAFSITDGLFKAMELALAEAFSITDDEELRKYMYMKIRKINITFSAGNYESNIELEN